MKALRRDNLERHREGNRTIDYDSMQVKVTSRIIAVHLILRELEFLEVLKLNS